MLFRETLREREREREREIYEIPMFLNKFECGPYPLSLKGLYLLKACCIWYFREGILTKFYAKGQDKKMHV